jgi:hypothetical protein
MSRSSVFYVVKAMERVAAGTAADGVPGVPASQAVVREAPTGTHPDGGIPSLVRRVLAVVHLGTGGAQGRAGRDARRLGSAARAD